MDLMPKPPGDRSPIEKFFDNLVERQQDPPPQATETTRSLKLLYVILLVIGLAIGAVCAMGVVALLHRFGLTEVPEQVD
ncbi:MAG: hypothetical protein HC925_09570 [Coleofasciculaceae cyanobacterium SM2_3_26]|nr:hypothetical protein [Coleofasciculaceae cyanobacterium SM2_3_26]